MDLKSISILVIAGPTGVGKTQLSIDLAKEFNGEIINGDSLQVYKHLDIGTGKITPSEMKFQNLITQVNLNMNLQN